MHLSQAIQAIPSASPVRRLGAHGHVQGPIVIGNKRGPQWSGSPPSRQSSRDVSQTRHQQTRSSASFPAVVHELILTHSVPYFPRSANIFQSSHHVQPNGRREQTRSQSRRKPHFPDRAPQLARETLAASSRRAGSEEPQHPPEQQCCPVSCHHWMVFVRVSPYV